MTLKRFPHKINNESHPFKNIFQSSASFLNLFLLIPTPCPAMPASLKPFSLEFVAAPATVTPVEEIIRASRRVITEAECEIAVTKLCLWPHDQPKTTSPHSLPHTSSSSRLILNFTFPLLLCVLFYSKFLLCRTNFCFVHMHHIQTSELFLIYPHEIKTTLFEVHVNTSAC